MSPGGELSPSIVIPEIATPPGPASTVNRFAGLVGPIPRFPTGSIRIRSTLFVLTTSGRASLRPRKFAPGSIPPSPRTFRGRETGDAAGLRMRPRPHAAPGLTLAGLGGGRAPVGRDLGCGLAVSLRVLLLGRWSARSGAAPARSPRGDSVLRRAVSRTVQHADVRAA